MWGKCKQKPKQSPGYVDSSLNSKTNLLAHIRASKYSQQVLLTCKKIH